MRIAAITMVRDEPVFLPLWIQHYGAQFGKENLFIVDHASRSLDARGVKSIISLPDTELSERQRSLFISRLHSSLLAYYDCVVYTDVDEFLVADPARYSGLRNLIQQTPQKVVSAIGLNVLHDRGFEPDLNFEQPILIQRQWAQFDPMFCKPLISRQLILWQSGFHFAVDVPNSVHVGLFLFHLKSADWTTAQQIRAERNKIVRSKHDQNIGQSSHFGLSDTEHELRYFGTDHGRLASTVVSDFTFRDALQAYVADCRATERIPKIIDRIPDRFHNTILGIQN